MSESMLGTESLVWVVSTQLHDKVSAPLGGMLHQRTDAQTILVGKVEVHVPWLAARTKSMTENDPQVYRDKIHINCTDSVKPDEGPHRNKIRSICLEAVYLETYCFLNFSRRTGEGEPIISWILATWSSSFDPGNRGRRLCTWKGREKNTVHTIFTLCIR